MKSVLLTLLDDQRPPVPTSTLNSTLDIIESWLTRRMLIRATTKSYNQVAAEIVAIIRQTPAESLDQSIRSYFVSQTAKAKYWPDNDELQNELVKMPIYRKIGRSRLRMILEAVEDYERGYHPGGNEYAGMRVPRNVFWIEHIMPQSWEASWPPPSRGSLQDRAQLVHALGNLTLLTSKLNAAVSNGPWDGDAGKKAALTKHDLLMLNRQLTPFSDDGWTDTSIRRRTETIIRTIIDIWRVPAGYRSSTVRDMSPRFHSVDLSDLISAGLVTVGQALIPHPINLQSHVGTILSDGRIDVDGRIFDTPSGAVPPRVSPSPERRGRARASRPRRRILISECCTESGRGRHLACAPVRTRTSPTLRASANRSRCRDRDAAPVRLRRL